MTGWTLTDSAGNRYTFPSYTLGSGKTVTVHYGDGSNTARNLYAGWGYTWNNTGDTAYLRNQAGTLVDTCTWGDGPGRTTC